MGNQQLVNGQIIITEIAKYSITNVSSLNLPKFEPCVDAYGQLIYIITKDKKEITPAFDHYNQLITIS